MTGTIFRDTLRANWKQVLYWGIGMGVLGIYVVAIASSSEILEGYGEIMESLPPALLGIFGISDARLFTSVEGFVTGAYVTYAMLILSVFAVMAGLNITANEEDSGVMDVVLALPVSRMAIIIEKFIAYAVLSLGIIAFCIVIPLLGIIIFNVEADVGKIVLSTLNIYPGILLIISVTCLIGTIVRRRMTAMGLSAGFVIVSYFVNFLGESASETFAATLQQLSLFNHTNSESIILDAFSPVGSIVLLIVTVICVGCAVMMFDRRDVGL